MKEFNVRNPTVLCGVVRVPMRRPEDRKCKKTLADENDAEADNQEMGPWVLQT